MQQQQTRTIYKLAPSNNAGSLNTDWNHASLKFVALESASPMVNSVAVVEAPNLNL